MDLRIKGSDYTVFNTYCLLLTNEREWQLLSQKNILVMEAFCYYACPVPVIMHSLWFADHLTVMLKLRLTEELNLQSIIQTAQSLSDNLQSVVLPKYSYGQEYVSSGTPYVTFTALRDESVYVCDRYCYLGSAVYFCMFGFIHKIIMCMCFILC